MSHIQGVFAGGGNTSTTMTVSGSAIGSGNGICGAIYGNFSTGTPTTANFAVSDNATGNPNSAKYVVDSVSPVGHGSNNFGVQFHGINLTGGPTSITITVSSFTFGANTVAMLWDEFSAELATGQALDQKQLQDIATATGSDATKGSNVTTTGTGLAWAWGGVDSGSSLLTPGTAFTAGVTDNTDQIYSEFILSHSAGAIASTWNDTTAGDNYFLGILTFKSSAVSYIPPRRLVKAYSLNAKITH